MSFYKHIKEKKESFLVKCKSCKSPKTYFNEKLFDTKIVIKSNQKKKL